MIARWEIGPLHRSRRGIDESLLLAVPWLARWLLSPVYRARPGSRLRRGVLGRAARVGAAANNRSDYEAMCVLMCRDVELHVYPDAPMSRPVDAQPIYTGRDGYVKAVEDLKAGFGTFRWELRELFDAGGDWFGARTERVGRGSLSGAEVRSEDFQVWQVERGLLRRQWTLSSETAMLALLEGEHRLTRQGTAADPST